MNKKKLLIIVVSGFVILLSAILVYSGNPSLRGNIGLNNTGINSRGSEMELVNVEKIVENPEKFSGLVSVEGTVTEVINNKKLFTLGCEDVCVNLPVAYKGELPKATSNIIASGEIKKDADGKFFFDAKEIKYK